MCARIMSKDNVTKTLSELSNKNPEDFVISLGNIEGFVKKILVLIDNDESRIRDLFNHSRKGTQYKTDQNYYFLWAMLLDISLEEIETEKEKVFSQIRTMFAIIQKTPVDCTVEKFIGMLREFHKYNIESV